MAKLYETINARNWCKQSYGQDHQGRAVGLTSDDAVRWCLRAHSVKLSLENHAQQLERLRVALCTLGFIEEPSVFNDHPDTTIEDVIRVCKVADV